MTASPIDTTITAAMVETYQRDGVVLIPGLLRDRVTSLAEALADNIANPGAFERTYQPEDGTARFFQDYCNWQRFDGYRDAILHSPMADAATRLMRSSTARIFHEHVLVKEPGSSMPTPWHQDQPYYLVEGTQSVSFWVPLDPVPREIAIEYVARSHRWGKQFRPDRFNGTALFDGDTSEAVPNVERDRAHLNIVGWAMQPGDAIAFNFSTLHGAPANTTPNRRRAISFRWVGDDARFAKRQGRTSPPFPHLDVVDGAPFDGPDFPIIGRHS
jgi:ectoine hydroxylase-related dioxygenase (phytanoyl-CoA dioxygenase family)